MCVPHVQGPAVCSAALMANVFANPELQGTSVTGVKTITTTSDLR